MKNAMVGRILEKLLERTGKSFIYDEVNDWFETDINGLDNEMIGDIQSVFMGQTYGVYTWRVEDNMLILPYFLCRCHGCTRTRNKIREAGEWIGDDEK